MAEFCGTDEDYTNYLLRKYGGAGQQVSRGTVTAAMVCWFVACRTAST